jgi:Protein of unknown function (DUF3102)
MSISHAVNVPSPEKVLPFAPFEYTDLSASVAKFLRSQAERIRRNAASSIINVGKDLIGAKHYLSHGAFIAWVESEVGIPARTAQAYMRVAKWASHKNATVAHLQPSLLYLLSNPSTPTSFGDDVLKRIEAGERISLRAIRDELRDLRDSPCDEHQGQGRIMLPRARHETTTPMKDPTLLEAIAILARGLSAQDFNRVKEIMTAKSVLDDPDLPQQIVTAFLTLDNPTGNDRSLSS